MLRQSPGSVRSRGSGVARTVIMASRRKPLRFGVSYGLRHRARAAFLAASLRSSGVIFLARALPPASPPSLPRATAAGFFPSPVASSTMLAAMTFTSWDWRLLERFGMALVYHMGLYVYFFGTG